MSNLRYSLVTMNGEKAITLFHDGAMYVADSTHPAWEKIWQEVVVDDNLTSDPKRLFDPTVHVQESFKRVSDRVTMAGGTVYFDGDAVHSALTNQIVRFVEDGVDEFEALVNFMEKVYQNPSDSSRDQMYEWLIKNEFSILPNGDIVGYKKVHKTDTDGVFQSVSSGRALVNDRVQSGRIKQSLGDVVTMPRSEVDDNSGVGCSTGLHVSNWSYAESFSDHNAPMLKVAVNPRDVVSVPNDSSFQKVRVCRYEVLEVVDAPVSGPLDSSYSSYYEDVDDFEDDEWGDGEGDDDWDAQSLTIRKH